MFHLFILRMVMALLNTTVSREKNVSWELDEFPTREELFSRMTKEKD
ncbi:Uncharacterised protein [Streptococcus pneumoniae]|nr:Uncharacterised protein [Streptococcus pneumoniae]